MSLQTNYYTNDPNQRLGESKEDEMVDKDMYQRLVGKLIYLSHTRPDIAYAVSIVSQFLHSPRKAHLQAVHRILQYLKGSLGKGILFKRDTGLHIEAYTNADYVRSVTNRRSTFGIVFLLTET